MLFKKHATLTTKIVSLVRGSLRNIEVAQRQPDNTSEQAFVDYTCLSYIGIEPEIHQCLQHAVDLAWLPLLFGSYYPVWNDKIRTDWFGTFDQISLL